MTYKQYESVIRQAASRYGVAPELLLAIAQKESNFNPNAFNSSGAAGMFQLMPGTAKEVGVSNVYNAEQNIEGGAKYFSQMLKMFGGDKDKALAAYNFGPGNVSRGKAYPAETRDYIQKVKQYEKEYGPQWTAPSEPKWGAQKLPEIEWTGPGEPQQFDLLNGSRPRGVLANRGGDRNMPYPLPSPLPVNGNKQSLMRLLPQNGQNIQWDTTGSPAPTATPPQGLSQLPYSLNNMRDIDWSTIQEPQAPPVSALQTILQPNPVTGTMGFAQQDSTAEQPPPQAQASPYNDILSQLTQQVNTGYDTQQKQYQDMLQPVFQKQDLGKMALLAGLGMLLSGKLQGGLVGPAAMLAKKYNKNEAIKTKLMELADKKTEAIQGIPKQIGEVATTQKTLAEINAMPEKQRLENKKAESEIAASNALADFRKSQSENTAKIDKANAEIAALKQDNKNKTALEQIKNQITIGKLQEKINNLSSKGEQKFATTIAGLFAQGKITYEQLKELELTAKETPAQKKKREDAEKAAREAAKNGNGSIFQQQLGY